MRKERLLLWLLLILWLFAVTSKRKTSDVAKPNTVEVDTVVIDQSKANSDHQLETSTRVNELIEVICRGLSI